MNGKVLLSQLNPAGTRQLIEGMPPFELVIGNAANVRLRYNDAPVDLKPYFKVDVAHLKLE
jgi:cytoskeleton protein RodZ